MADKPAAEVRGLREFRRDLRKLDTEADKELREGIRDAARTTLDRADVPVRSGALKRSLKISVTARQVSIYSLLPYAPVVHWGGEIEPRGVPIRFPRTEFITKAVEAGADRLVEDIGDSVERAAKRAGWH